MILPRSRAPQTACWPPNTERHRHSVFDATSLYMKSRALLGGPQVTHSTGQDGKFALHNLRNCEADLDIVIRRSFIVPVTEIIEAAKARSRAQTNAESIVLIQRWTFATPGGAGQR